MLRNQFVFLVIFSSLFLAAGCGDGAKTSEAEPENPFGPSEVSDVNGMKIVKINVQRGTWDRLKEIGLAFHKFRDSYSGFPLPGAHKVNDVPEFGGKLSWRVWLLSHLDNSPLYHRFNTAEDWDSEHNRKLISEMPIVYNSVPPRNDGKSSFHVFVGNGAPFSENESPSRFDYRGRMDKTILVVEAGPDKAVEWTKPGGLKFDPKNPKAALGNVPDEFRAVMMDGSVKKFPKDISNEELLELITGGKTPGSDGQNDTAP